MEKIELLSPAGSPECLNAAVGEGADAVYLGLKTFNARLRSANFAYSQYEGALRSLHKMGKKLYVAVNTVFEQRESDRMYQLLKYLSQTGPDAVIAQDLGVIKMAHSYFPDIKIHASTQMNVSSSEAVKTLSQYGVKRFVLARELSAKEIESVSKGANAEIEVFVHGALCVSSSGLCLFSSFLGGKSANRGLCTQACRRLYSTDSEESGYYFSPGDLQLIENVKTLAGLGVSAFKIEGRMKSAEYVAAVTSAYRLVLDALDAPENVYEKAVGRALEILKGDFARSKTTYLFNDDAGFSWLEPSQNGGTGIFLGKIEKTYGPPENPLAIIQGCDVAVEEGDSIRLHSANDLRRVSCKISFAQKKGSVLRISIPEGFKAGDSVYLIQKKAKNRRYSDVIPHNLNAFKKQPGFDSAPAMEIAPLKKSRNYAKNAGSELKEGLYVFVSCIKDLYIAQTYRASGVIVPWNKETEASVIRHQSGPLPFKNEKIIFFLDPVTTDEEDEKLAASLPVLLRNGYKFFIVNNLSQFYFLKKTAGAKIIAGPYIYTFNRYSLSLALDLGAEFFITPLENNRQNLEKTFLPRDRSRAFITIYGNPALFRIRAGLGPAYKFKHFTDNHEDVFRISSLFAAKSATNTIVTTEKPFSITDKTPFLKQAGFSRFILDFSTAPLKKHIFKDVLKSVENAAPIYGSSRFNWKNGFYQLKEDSPLHDAVKTELKPNK
ncbi:MAG: U32 family peptidase [Spirochaetaceae bacterium]|jgi:putative protease|nr:U32 family peptidase [Spirochaetaceae bacterium]